MLCAVDPAAFDPEKLATSGTPYVLAVCLMAVSAALVWVYRTYRGDVREMLAKHDERIDELATRHEAAEQRWRDDMKQQRAEFTATLKEVAGQIAARMERLEQRGK